jgi:hypothetical protein
MKGSTGASEAKPGRARLFGLSCRCETQIWRPNGAVLLWIQAVVATRRPQGRCSCVLYWESLRC